MMDRLAKAAKALTAFGVAAYAFYQAAKGAGSPGGVDITFDEWADIVVNGMVVGGGVWLVPNAKAETPLQ